MTPFIVFLSLSLFLGSLVSAHPLSARATTPCFVVGKIPLPADVQTTVTQIASSITCSSSSKTIGLAPDVSSGGITFSSINFATSSLTPIKFAVQTFTTSSPLAGNDLSLFEDRLNVYLATEVALRSTGGNLNIRAPKFFLEFQVARIKTAQGIPITDPGQTVQHLLQKVISSAPDMDQATLDLILALSILLS